jgi:Tol biopolymer transport system component/predicted Ser/Thr protein kinase
MTLPAGTRLGPYQILAPIGAGGMGEVYRARDERLGRDVAIKVLPASLAESGERLKRFEKEARSASALNHPNIVTIYDTGTTGGTSWIAMERVEGENLRKLLGAGPMPLKKLLAVATQIAEGLAKAHETGIVHRDLKPENLMVTREGTVKILDFGLAKLTAPTDESGGRTQSPTVSVGTEAGVVLGTVGYMSPEQALGEPLDFRSDQFALGSILYEMVSGRRAFARASAPETMAAIIREEPAPLATAAPETPIPLRWIVERCLAKDREERYAATRDLARDLAQLREGLSGGSLSSGVIAVPAARGRTRTLAVAAAVVLAAGIGIGIVATRKPQRGQPEYRPLTFRRGDIYTSRFAPDGETVLYTAAWQGRPAQLFSTRLDSTESTALPLPDETVILSISGSGKLAIMLDRNPPVIAEASLAGGAPRELVETQSGAGIAADWEPGGSRLAVVRDGRLEFPVGNVLVPAPAEGRVHALRFSPDGRRIAFLERRGQLDAVGVVDLAGKKTILSEGWEPAVSLAWHPTTGEIWFSAREGAGRTGVIELYAVSLSGVRRTVAQTPELLIVQDIARDGRVLARSDDWPMNMMCLPPGAPREVDLTWLDFSNSRALSDDGRDLVFTEGGAGAGAKGATYIRKTDGSAPAVRLGDGLTTQDLSPDKKWALQVWPDRLVLLPVGPGESRTIQDPSLLFRSARWFPDGKRLIIEAAAPGHPSRVYVRDLDGGPPRPVTPESTAGARISPDGKLVTAIDTKSGQWALYPVEGGEPRPLPGIQRGESVIRFDAGGTSLFLASGGLPLRIDRLELDSGKRTAWKEIVLADPTGADSIANVQLTPDGKCYCYSFIRNLSRLYVVENLR